MTALPFLPIAAAALEPHPGMVLPFVLLLACIAICPAAVPHFWERQYRTVAVGLGAVSVFYYLAVLHAPERVGHALSEYVSFIVFIGALFVVSGGIYIRVKGEATPTRNCLYLIVGAVLANVMGTTGASMMLIRPWIRMNKYRFTGFHVPFFIFIVSNVGGCLTPIGDPPLFLGYLLGVPFFWITAKAWPAWLVGVGLLVGLFYLFDRYNFVRAPRDVRERETAHETFGIMGAKNFLPLAVILVSVILLPAGLREVVIVAAAIYSYRTTAKPVHEANHFTFGPIKEVAWLFIGIFATMVPAIDYLQGHAAEMGIREPMHFYWMSGSLSAVLDNAPTYVTFLAAAFGLQGEAMAPGGMHAFLAQHGVFAVAVSLGSVMFGAVTYIGNGPNLMVKGICDHARVHTPGFFTYILKYSLPLLVPVLAIVGWLFVHRS